VRSGPPQAATKASDHATMLRNREDKGFGALVAAPTPRRIEQQIDISAQLEGLAFPGWIASNSAPSQSRPTRALLVTSALRSRAIQHAQTKQNIAAPLKGSPVRSIQGPWTLRRIGLDPPAGSYACCASMGPA